MYADTNRRKYETGSDVIILSAASNNIIFGTVGIVSKSGYKNCYVYGSGPKRSRVMTLSSIPEVTSLSISVSLKPPYDWFWIGESIYIRKGHNTIENATPTKTRKWRHQLFNLHQTPPCLVPFYSNRREDEDNIYFHGSKSNTFQITLCSFGYNDFSS